MKKLLIIFALILIVSAFCDDDFTLLPFYPEPVIGLVPYDEKYFDSQEEYQEYVEWFKNYTPMYDNMPHEPMYWQDWKNHKAWEESAKDTITAKTQDEIEVTYSDTLRISIPAGKYIGCSDTKLGDLLDLIAKVDSLYARIKQLEDKVAELEKHKGKVIGNITPCDGLEEK